MNNNLKKYSNIISVISKILWILSLVLTIIMAIGGTILSFLFSRLEVDNYNNINFYNNTLEIESIITNTPDEQKEVLELMIYYLKTFLKEHNKSQKFLMAETIVILAVSEMILIIMTLFNIDKLFKNITSKETPFIKENSSIIKYICLLLLIYCFIDSVGTSFISSLYGLDFNSSMSIWFLFILFIIYTLSYIFDYGRNLELKLKKEGKNNEK